ncbi:MAG: TonB-dependent receptor [Sterolibacterium sp.]|jgi:iron complex outermembrane receptor protein|nr:TonB-dependent receptor [Sterolibacterium sp.]
MNPMFRYSAMTMTLACALNVHAEQVQEVVITATRSAKSTADAPATVSVVGAREIEARNIQSADEALTHIPGAYASRPGGHEPSVMGTHIMLRGIPDASRTLVLVDGQTLNDPYIGTVTWESVPTETIERIEVVPGPFSSLYGGSAMGGVINIITKAPTKRAVTVRGGLGTDDFRAGSVVYQDRFGPSVAVVFDYGYKRSDGFIKDDVLLSAVISGSVGSGATSVSGATRTTDASGNVRYRVGDKGKAGWTAENVGVKLYWDIDHSSHVILGASQFLYTSSGRNHYHTDLTNAAGTPVSSGNVVLAGGARLSVRESQFLTGPDSEIKEYSRYSASYEKAFDNGAALKATLGFADMPLYNNYIVLSPGATLAAGGTASRMLRPSSEISAGLQGSLPLSASQKLALGLSAVKRSIDTVTYAISDWRNPGAMGPIKNHTAGEDTTYSFYAQDEIALAERLTAYVGGRYDKWSTQGEIEQVEAPGAYRNEFEARKQSHFSPKLSLVWRPVEAITVRGSVGTSFHTPNLRDTFGWWTPTTGYTFTPNPGLKPETVTSWELGGEQRLQGGTLLRATVFENRLKDLIYRTQSDSLMAQGVENAGKARVRGIELEVRQPLMAGLTTYANVTFNDPKITENFAKPLTVGKVMTATPRRMANLGIEGSYGAWRGSLGGHYVGKVYNNEENRDVINGVYGAYDPFFLVDAKLAYKFDEHTSVSVSGSNLSDRKYYQSSRAQGRAFFAEVVFKY